MENDKVISLINKLKVLRDELDKNNIEDLKENKMLYNLAFIALIRNGVDFNIINKVIGEKEEKKKAFISFSTAPKEKEIITKEYVEIKTGMGDFSCSVNNLKQYLGEEEYKTLILKITDKPSVEPKTFNLAEYDETLGIVEEEKKEVIKTKKTDDEDTEESLPSRLPHFYEDKSLEPDFPGKKFLSTMLYHIHTLDITVNGVDLKAVFAIYPIRMTADDPATDIAVSATLYDPVSRAYSAPRGGISRGSSAAVNVEFDDVVFVIYGAWDKGLFKSYVRSTKKNVEITNDNLTEHLPDKEKTSTTFMKVTEIPGVNVYVFPAVIGENTSNGFIIGAIAVENPEEKSLVMLFPTTNGEFIISSGETEYSFGAYWQGQGVKDLALTYIIDEHDLNDIE